MFCLPTSSYRFTESKMHFSTIHSHRSSSSTVNRISTGIMLCTVLVICFAAGCAANSDFGYDSDDTGPDHWADHYQECSGKFQSPIDIEEDWVSRVSLPPLQFTGFNDLPLETKVTNNGHTVLLELDRSSEFQVSGGPLRGDYSFAQLHFHWGVNDSVGSEDTINNHSYSMELHMVFYKTKYGDVDNAIKHKDGLLVLAIFYEAGHLDNLVYSEIVDSLKKIEYPKMSVMLHKGFTLKDFLPSDVEHYFTYNGSLTTPPCLEVVTWIDFKHPTRLSHKQLGEFRKLRSNAGYLTHNARPVQPLSGRQVYYNIGGYKDSATNLHSSKAQFATLLVAFYIAIHNLF
ncbi:carbonic anhydrase 2 [Nilaparvata lugens]|uniref:carbonic anhydrase 2 n=1 Tax=Nilaparvata lugens TaxID=108931 RepID=UPI00193D3D18|nr:carbonic anhydrase 2 [Nilaparvata lugens]XP_039290795.1 carbonic anhydrase 2 [Nilaparvata lugens]XP_039290796.1 carbonic anhydrase 2 [Nilaparvata lugens]